MHTPTKNASKNEIDALIDMSVESWRFARLFTKIISKLDAGESQRYIGQIRYFNKKIDDNLQSVGLRLVNLEGQNYDPGMAISPLNAADFPPDTRLVIEQMVEPIIMGPDGVMKSGTATLASAGDQ